MYWPIEQVDVVAILIIWRESLVTGFVSKQLPVMVGEGTLNFIVLGKIILK